MAFRPVLLSDVCAGRDNNFNLIRMVAAGAVLVSHAWPMTRGPLTIQPLDRILGFELGRIAVMVFFAISGFLIARSFERQPTVRRWLAARVLRLYPALTVMLVLTVVVLGPAVTTLPLDAYFADPLTHSYVPNNLSLALRQSELPGVFADQIYPHQINGSLWSLYFEVMCYGGVLAMGLLGAFRSRVVLLLCAAAYAGLNLWVLTVDSSTLPSDLRLLLWTGMPFSCGVAFYFLRAWLPMSVWLLAPMIVAAAVVRDTKLYHPAFVLALTYGVFLLAYLPKGAVLRYNALGDYSYGVYIYAWPVQQTAVHFFGPMGPLANIAIAAPITLGLAWLSWTLIEKPALGLVRHAGGRRVGGAKATAGS